MADLDLRRVVIEPVTRAGPPVSLPLLLADIELEPEHEASRPAWRLLLVMLLALLTGALLDSSALLHSATGRHLGMARDVMTAVSQPVDDTARTLGLDTPRRLADAALGRTTEDSGPGLAQAVPAASAPTALPTAVPSLAALPPTAFRHAGPANPLHVWITGDSDVAYVGLALLDATAPQATVRAVKGIDVHIGTGLVRPDIFDWLKYARKQAPKRAADAVVVALGGNDAQGIPIGSGRAVQPGDPQWKALYAQRAILVARELSLQGTRPVYWINLPAARDPLTNHAYFEIDAALAYASSQVPGMRVIDAMAVLSVHGRYSPYLPDKHGNQVLVRQSDGVHATFDGSRWITAVLLARLRQDWGL